ncbi:hypothetical protein ScPMuIL_012031 [Solemya velum]
MARDKCGQLFDPAGDDSSTFEVLAKFWDRNGASNVATWVEQVTIRLATPTNTIIKIAQGPALYVNGAQTKTPYPVGASSLPYSVFKIGNFIVVQVDDIGLMVEFDGDRLLKVKLSRGYMDDTCGLCGVLNDNTSDDFTQGPACSAGGLLLAGSVADTSEKFANSWATTADCCSTTAPPPCEDFDIMVASEELFVYPFEDVFRNCISGKSILELEFLYQSYVTDVCNGGDPCEIIKDVFGDCCAQGLDIQDWGIYTYCKPTCGFNETYSFCGPPMSVTCTEFLNGDVPVPNGDESFFPACRCVPGHYVDETGTCVLPSYCGCNDGGVYMTVGEETIETPCTTKRVCHESNNVTSEPTMCDVNATCSVQGATVVCSCPNTTVDINGDGSDCSDSMGSNNTTGPCQDVNCNHGVCVDCLLTPNNCTSGTSADTQCVCNGCWTGDACDLERCSPGYYSADGFAPCSPCPAGTFQDECGGSCVLCPDETTSYSGSDSCMFCPLNWNTLNVSISSSCYTFCGKDKTFALAEARCEGKGGKMITIETQAENDIIYAHIGHLATLWTGLQVLEHKVPVSTSVVEWYAHPGVPVNYTNFAINEPNSSGIETCVSMLKGSGQWNDIPCDKTLRCACEMQFLYLTVAKRLVEGDDLAKNYVLMIPGMSHQVRAAGNTALALPHLTSDFVSCQVGFYSRRLGTYEHQIAEIP